MRLTIIRMSGARIRIRAYSIDYTLDPIMAEEFAMKDTNSKIGLCVGGVNYGSESETTTRCNFGFRIGR